LRRLIRPIILRGTDEGSAGCIATETKERLSHGQGNSVVAARHSDPDHHPVAAVLALIDAPVGLDKGDRHALMRGC
jgi:hypothetical protein